MYFIIFWKFWNWPSYSIESILYWLRCHQVVETRSLTVKDLMSTSWYFRLWMWTYTGTLHCSCSRTHTDYGNSHGSGFNIKNTVITSHSSQYNMNGPFFSMSSKYWGHSEIGPFRCRRGIQAHCITLLQYTMPCSIIWMVWCELWLRRRLNGRKTCSSLWS